jgi:hypothetical protein
MFYFVSGLDFDVHLLAGLAHCCHDGAGMVDQVGLIGGALVAGLDEDVVGLGGLGRLVADALERQAFDYVIVAEGFAEDLDCDGPILELPADIVEVFTPLFFGDWGGGLGAHESSRKGYCSDSWWGGLKIIVLFVGRGFMRQSLGRFRAIAGGLKNAKNPHPAVPELTEDRARAKEGACDCPARPTWPGGILFTEADVSARLFWSIIPIWEAACR